MKRPENLMEFISAIPDPRVRGRTKHFLNEVIVIAVCAVLSGAESWVDVADWGHQKRDWLKKFLKLPNGIPSHDTFGRVFSILDSEALQKMFYDWVEQFLLEGPGKNIINIDGKFLNGSLKKNDSRTSTSMVSAWSSTLGLVLGVKESKLEKDLGEKRATERLLDNLFLKGAIVTLDANGATTTITEKIVQKKGDYIIGLKDNQRTLKRLCKHVFEDDKNVEHLSTYETFEKGHGRREKRCYDFLSIEKCNEAGIEKMLQKQMAKWNTLGGFCRVRSERSEGGKLASETRYYFTSLQVDAQTIGDAIRSHWAVENSLHWTMDVTFREDESRVRVKHAAANLAVIRRMALNMLKKESSMERSMRRKRKLCGWDTNYLEKVIWGNHHV